MCFNDCGKKKHYCLFCFLKSCQGGVLRRELSEKVNNSSNESSSKNGEKELAALVSMSGQMCSNVFGCCSTHSNTQRGAQTKIKMC